MTEIYLHFLCAHYGLSGNAPVWRGRYLATPYLVLYNAVQTVGWGWVLCRALHTLFLGGGGVTALCAAVRGPLFFFQVRLKIIGNEIMKTVGKSESRMVSKSRIIYMQTAPGVARSSALAARHRALPSPNRRLAAVFAAGFGRGRRALLGRISKYGCVYN